MGKDTNGNIGLYKITVEETFANPANPHDNRFHNLKYVEKVADSIGSLTRENSVRGAESTNDVSTTDFTVSDLYELVKQFDKDFTAAHEVNPVLLNEDGTLKVFYHGTGESFNFFSTDEFGAREGSFFFSEN